MTQNEWQARLTCVVAAQVRYYRKLRGLSTQQLSERTAALEFEVPRAVLSNLETGRRESVSLAEVLVLAQALRVAPALLVAPAGREESVEILPNRAISPFDAVRWLAGDVYLEERTDALKVRLVDAEDDTLYLFQRHHWLLADWSAAAKGFMDTPEGLFVPASDELISMRRRNVGREIRKLRVQMRELDLQPPQLPGELAYLDDMTEGQRTLPGSWVRAAADPRNRDA